MTDGFAGKFEDQDEHFLATDIMGACAGEPANEVDIAFVKPIQGGETAVDCISWSTASSIANPDNKEVVVAPCDAQ
jgi:hypothetical protein